MTTLKLKELTLDLEATDNKGCKGQVYQLKENFYVDSRGNFTTKTTMVLKKRMSCRGCEKCGWEQDNIVEDVACGKAPIINDPQPDAFYWLRVTNPSTDWETGYLDNWDIEFVRLP